MTLRSLARTAVLVLAFAGAAGAQIADFETQREEAQSALVTRLHDYADWCKEMRLFQSRECAFLRLIELDPDDAVARKGLGYSKKGDGVWVPPKKPKEYKDFDRGGLEEQPARLAAALDPYLETMRAFLADPQLAADQRLVVVQGILFANPDDPEIRAERGEVHAGDRWVLAETATSLRRRASLAGEVRAALSSDEGLEPAQADEREAAFGLDWTAVVATPDARVCGTVPSEEVWNAARVLTATIRVFGAALGEAGLPEGTLVVLLQGPDDRNAFLNGHAGLDDATRDAMRNGPGGWIPGTNEVAYWSDDPVKRIDGLVRMVIAYLLGDGFGVTTVHHWIHEGFGLYLTDALVGTHMTWFVSPVDDIGVGSLQEEMIESTDWRRLAFDRFQDAGHPQFRELLSKPPSEYLVADVLYTFVVAAFLIEGRPEETRAVLEALGKGGESPEVLPAEIGYRLGDIDARIMRWLDETTAVAKGELIVADASAPAPEDD